MAADTRWRGGAHPTPDELLLAHEGQMSREEAAPVLAHLQQCWECRGRVEAFARGVDAYLRFRKDTFNPAATPLPGGWTRFAVRERAAERPAPRRALPGMAWLAAPVVLGLAWLAIATLMTPPSLTAKTVLERALRADTSAVPAVGFVRVHRGGKLVAAEDVVLREARIDRRRALSVAPYREWHDSLPSREDALIHLPNEIRIQTTTDVGAIALASLTLGSADYVPHAKHVELRDGVTIDVDTVNAASPAPKVAAIDSPAAGAARLPTPAAEREAIEMEVRWALRRIDADLGEPLEIHTAGDDVVVSGTVDDAARRDQIVGALEEVRGVAPSLRVATVEAAAIETAKPIQTGSAGSPLLAEQLANDFPQAEERRAFVSRALRLSQTIMRHSWALKRLAERYPAAVAAALPLGARESLERLAAAHRQAIALALAETASLWKPYAPLAPGREAGGPWQDTAPVTLSESLAFDHATVRLVAGGGNEGLTTAEALQQLVAAYGRLQ